MCPRLRVVIQGVASVTHFFFSASRWEGYVVRSGSQLVPRVFAECPLLKNTYSPLPARDHNVLAPIAVQVRYAQPHPYSDYVVRSASGALPGPKYGVR